MKERTLARIVENFYLRGSEAAYKHRRGYRNLQWSYRQIATSAIQLAKELQQRGINPGDRIFLWGEDCAEWVISFLGSVLMGAVVVPMDRTASAEFASRVYRQVNARLCIASRGHPNPGFSQAILDFESLAEVIGGQSAEGLNFPVAGDQDTVEIVFTSGTTADPKGVVLSHKNILANLDPLETEIGKYLKYERLVHPIRFLNLLPLSHVFGQFLGIFIPQMLGSPVIFQNSLNPSEIMRTIKRERVSVLVTVPRVMEALRDKMLRDMKALGKLETFEREFAKADNEHFIMRWWRFRRIHSQLGWKFWAFISGGASLSSEAEQFWGRLGFAVIQGYGLTETTSLISVNHPLKLGKGSIGKILPGRELKLAPGGEILVRGESVAKSYYQGNDMKPVLGEEGWFHTGDMGALDEQGNLYFKGRSKNVIVSPEGMNIYPEDLEIALRQQPEVRDCVVLGLERGGNSEACAVLILHDKNQKPETVIKRANESLAEFQHIRRWFVWPEEDFPRTSTQKPQTKRINEFVVSQLERTGGAAAEFRVLSDLISGITGRRIGKISSGSSLVEDLNLTSIERVELLSALEDRFQLDLNESRFTSASTIGELEKMLSQPDRAQSDFSYPRWAQRTPIAIMRLLVFYLLVYPATLVMAYPNIRGRENIRDLKGPLLFVSNHITQVDIGFILAALPLRFRHRLAVAMIGEILQKMRHPPKSMNFIRRCLEKSAYALVVALFNVFPLPQKTGFRQSFAFAGESVDRGFSILVFPEGMRTRDGKMCHFRSGIGLLAVNLGVAAVPIRIDGLFEMKQSGKKLARPGTISVTIGSALRFDTDTDPLEIAGILEARVLALKDAP
jgi:long-chain acyl-CoA synthetase